MYPNLPKSLDVVRTLRSLIVYLWLSAACVASAQKTLQCEVLVVGGGTGGIGAALQSARLGARTMLFEPTPWLGGMIASAGVSATDGNHRLPSGIWKEFRDALYVHYGGEQAVNTGWVSNTHFEPHVADSIFKTMAAREPLLSVRHGLTFVRTLKVGAKVRGAIFQDEKGKTIQVTAAVTVDATELGDVFAEAGAAYSLGVEARAETGEQTASPVASKVIQDLTWAAILKDYGPTADQTLPATATYRPSDFYCCCLDKCNKAEKVHPCSTMLSYAKLPHGKIMINWPLHGNDIYLNVVEANAATREKAWQLARAQTLNFVRYMQVELGYRHLGLADDEFPTPDRLPFIPYHREGRRIKGLVQLTTTHLLAPFDQQEALYKTGIAVGDYPLDHHHAKAPEPIDEQFPAIPSFNIPLGALIPQKLDGLVVAEKGISVTHLVNGATRLQPCVLLIGQAAGALAALAARKRLPPRRVPVRTVQQALLDAHAFLMPYLDVSPDDPAWQSVQHMGAAGLLRGTGIPHDWANETWFYPDSTLQNTDFLSALQIWQPGFYANVRMAPGLLTLDTAADMLQQLLENDPEGLRKSQAKGLKGCATLPECLPDIWGKKLGLSRYNPQRAITRRELAVLTDAILAPFDRPVDWKGGW